MIHLLYQYYHDNNSQIFNTNWIRIVRHQHSTPFQGKSKVLKYSAG